ncbi:DUF3000 domain-containing protein [Stackebrandtia nassauensis]|uniref:DUF3000 domain-containing protein n=1 Tax=Stackebrandtia nassauensis (strain DSM 44728 / CIP 108903 / NRRL B-16338 / NBRC 102104 / LLR-40K-21) TaxID=446470 RepID=D3Q659_STANL|nr:DUF3000 domain-containing protein [Stackebrandtia nassauensis]ADD42234.1 hypothetical protein Snas_2553 [Stackebrandtia nassauensis DSM 44728]
MAATTAVNEPAPDTFVRAVNQLRSGAVRARITIAEATAPRHIAPYSFALSADVDPPQGFKAEGRLILLHDPDGHDSWNGTLRLVTYLSVDVDLEMANDPMLSPVAWSWLLEGLGACDARFTAAGGTVTCTTSTRFGDLRDPRDFGADSEAVLELRASWTPCGDDLAAHTRAWQRLLAAATGLPPDEQAPFSS